MTQSDPASLRSVVAGSVFSPGDDGYKAATATWNLSSPARPPLVLVASTPEDVAAGARWADASDHGIAILNTGHGVFDGRDDALLINVAKLNAVQVDPARRTATVGPGARWADVSAIAAPLGFVGASGGSPGVGVIGYTLGGGLGPVGRTLGFAADRVTSLTVLNADYEPVRLGADDTEPFWALRGAGGIAIVTELELELAHIPELCGGGVYYDGAHAAALLTAYAAWVDRLDERTSTSIALMRLPDAPQLPPQLRGRFVVHLRFAHVDPASTDVVADGRRILAPMLAGAPVIDDDVRLMSPADLPDIHRDPTAPQDVEYRGGFIDRIDQRIVDAIVASMPPDAQPPAPQMIELRHLGGAFLHAPIAPSSVTGRDARFNLYVTASSSLEQRKPTRALVDGVVSRITTSRRAQFNFSGPAPAPGEVLGLWNETDAQRILSVADSLDPRNRIRTGRPLR